MRAKRLWKQTWGENMLRLSGESWDRSKWAGEGILEK